MIVSPEEGKAWYERNGISNEDWSSFDETTKNLIRLEATLVKLPEICDIRETGMPASSVLVYIRPEDINIEKKKAKYLNDSENDNDDLTSYVIQNSTRKIQQIFVIGTINVLCVRYVNGFIRLDIEPKL